GEGGDAVFGDGDRAVQLQAAFAAAGDAQLVGDAVDDDVAVVGRIATRAGVHLQADPLHLAGGQDLVVDDDLGDATGQRQQIDLAGRVVGDGDPLAVRGVDLDAAEFDPDMVGVIDGGIRDGQVQRAGRGAGTAPAATGRQQGGRHGAGQHGETRVA